jgi:hypothetical protein
MMSQKSPLQRPIRALISKGCRACLLTAVVILTTRQAVSIPTQQDVELKDEHQQASQQAVQRLEECARLERQFSQYDLYRSASSSKIYGVDVRGRVWTLKRDPSKGCALRTQHRLSKAEYEIDYLGNRIWSTFYYENKQLCLYTREADTKTTKRCYQPTGIISKLAPYFLN